MDPGQAFGTGLHATTRLTLQLFERSLGYYLDASRLSLIDVGTGTGILAIAASKLGVGKITAVDVDPIAVETAHENFQTNHTTEIALSDTPIQNIHEKFDIILANILLETHMELLKEYKRLMKPRGHLILSGLLAWQKAPILAALKKEGFITEVIDHLQDWLGVYAISRD
jgi:ribosomal protein L11 methyltransferase